MNALDRVIAAVSPQTAVKRAAARRKLDILDSGYGNYGASHTKKSLAGWLYGGGSAKEDIQDNLSTLRQRCRDLYMGVPLATGALKTCRTNVIGSGLRLKSQIDYEALGMDEEAARDLERKIEREFSLWADSTACDLERLDNFYELQQLAFLNWLMSGDVIATLPVTKRANMPYDLRICLIEADRLSNPNGIVDPEEAARDLERKIEREFSLWADSTACDLERLDNFYELQQLAFLNWLMSGDVIATLPVTKRANMPYDLRICLIEADRLSNPNGIVDPHIIGGVETNDAGEVVAYHISKHHPLSYDMTETGWTRVEAWGAKTGRRNVLHIMNRERIGQRRGVPFLAPVIEALKQLGRYTDAELVAAVVSGMFTVFIEKESASSDGGFGEIIPEDAQVDAGDDSTIELAPGAIVDLNEGEKAHDMNPGRPNTAFDGFVVAICRQIGAALEIPYELLVKNFNASYSASRGALLEAWKMFRMYRTWLANDFCQPVYEEWLAEAVAKGRIPAPGFFSDPLIRKAYTGAEWNGPAQGLLNPVQEVTAAEKRVQNGFSTRDREAMEMNGSDFYRNAAQLKREEKMLREVKENGENGNAAGKTEE